MKQKACYDNSFLLNRRVDWKVKFISCSRSNYNRPADECGKVVLDLVFSDVCFRDGGVDPGSRMALEGLNLLKLLASGSVLAGSANQKVVSSNLTRLIFREALQHKASRFFLFLRLPKSIAPVGELWWELSKTHILRLLPYIPHCQPLSSII